MPRNLILALAPLACLAACAAEEGTPAPDGGSSGLPDGGSLADSRLAQADLVGARDAYLAQLRASPSDSHSAVGAALAETLLLPDDPSFTGLLDACSLPHFNFVDQVFGASGILAKDRDARQGTASLALGRRQGQTGSFVSVSFAPLAIRTTSSDGWLSLRLRDTASSPLAGATAELDLSVAYAMASWTGGQATSLSNGLTVDATDFAGTLTFGLPGASGLTWESFSQPVSGSVTFDRVGTGKTGNPISITFNDLVLEGWPGSCPATGCTDADWPYLRVSGTISDTITVVPTLTTPFDAIQDDPGPPHRTSTIVLIDRCPGLSAEVLRTHLLTFLGSLETIDKQLAIPLKDPAAEAFQFRVPGSLFFVDGTIPLNIADVRVGKTACDLLLALGHGATQFRTLAKRFDELIDTYQLWFDAPSGPASSPERSFVVSRLVDELNSVFLDREPGFDLTAAQNWLLATLDDASAAVTLQPKNSGIFDFQALNARDFSSDVAAQLAFLRSSMVTGGLQGFPHSPDYLLSLKAELDYPVDLGTLHKVSQTGSGVFNLYPGAPDGGTAYDRNDRWDVDLAAVELAYAPVLALPKDYSSVPCGPMQSCPARYVCGPDPEAGTCQTPGFVLLDHDALKRAIPDSGQPAFVSLDALRPLLILQ